MAGENKTNEPVADASTTAKDIVFECGVCGKSLVINALGAGLAITCPDCGAEQQVPVPDDMEVDANADAAQVDEQKGDQPIPEISDVLADAHEQINALVLENEELQERRRILEKRYALTAQSLQSLRREMSAIRKSIERTEAILKTMEDPVAGDTQQIT